MLADQEDAMRARVAVVLSGLLMIAVAGCTGGGASSASGGQAAGGGQAVARPAVLAPQPAKAPPRSGSAPADQSIVRTADVTVRVRDIGAQAQRARTIAITAGGMVAADDRAGDGQAATADLVVKVPTASTDRVLDQLAGLGQAESQHLSSTDVSQQVTDVNSRVSSMRAAIARLRGLYTQAGSVAEILAVEARLSPREADLEALETQQRTLAEQTALAAITVHLRPVPIPPKSTHHARGVVHALQRGWSALAATVSWLLIAVSTALPFLAVGAVLGVGAIYLRRLRRRSPRPERDAPAETG